MAIAFVSIVVVSEGFNVNPVLGNPFSNKKFQIWKGGADGLRPKNSVKKRVEGIYLYLLFLLMYLIAYLPFIQL